MSKLMKREWVGWMARSDLRKAIDGRKWSSMGNPLDYCDEIWKTKGARDDYADYDWPPVKVRLILEVVS